MSRQDADRAQSIQIGAILLFGVLVILLATYQSIIVPDQNREVETNHADTVAQQLQELRNGIVSMAGTQGGTSVTVQLGTSYPARVVALNPPAPVGTLRTLGTDEADVSATVANGVATNDQVSEYWDGRDQTYRTGAIEYEPGYNEYRDPPTITYENSMLFHEFDDAVMAQADQRLVDGRRISLVTVNGTLDSSASGAISADLDAVSASTRRISITNSDDGPIELAFPSQMAPSQWRSQFVEAGEWENQTDSHGYVESVTGDSLSDERFDLIRVELTPDETYELQLTKVGLGTGVTQTDAAYITAVGEQSVESGESFTAEVRDSYNNPVSGVTVEPDGCDLDAKTTDADGQVSYECAQRGSVDLAIDGSSQPSQRVTFGIGTDAGSDSQDPDIDESATTASESTEEVCIDPRVWTCGEELDLSHVHLDYSVSDGQSGLDYVSFALRDGDDDVVTETSQELGGDAQRQSTWRSPRIDNDDVDVEDYDVRVRAVDEAGNAATCVADVVGGDCQPVSAPGEFQVTVDETNSPVAAGETLTVTATVENVGDETATRDVSLDVDGSQVDVQSLSLDGGASQTVTLAWETDSGDGGDYTATVDTGDDTASAPVSVDDGAQTLQPVESAGVDTQSSQLQFTVENTGDAEVQIQQFAVHATAVGPDVILNNGNDPELSTDGAQVDGSVNAPGNGNQFEADGTTYDLVDEGGDYADVGAGGNVVITLREFQEGWIEDSETLTYTDADGAEVTVTLVLADGREQTFHFRRPA